MQPISSHAADSLSQGVDSLAVYPPVGSGTIGYWGMLLQTLAYLVLLCVIAYAVVRWVLPRSLPRRFGPSRGITVLDQWNLGKGRSLCVVRVLKDYYLLGVTDHSIQCIATLPSPEVESTYSPPEPGKRRGRTRGLTGRGREEDDSQ